MNRRESAERREAIREGYKAGLTPAQIATQTGYTVGSVKALASAMGVGDSHREAAAKRGARRRADARINAELLAALTQLVADCEEYARINNLHNSDGSPATNHAMRQARAALLKAHGTSTPEAQS